MDNGNAQAFHLLAGLYFDGLMGLPQDYQKTNELNLKAGELECADGYFNLGVAYRDGIGVETDIKKAKHYFELAAMKGNVGARHNVGVEDYNTGNHQRAMKHFIIAAKAGYKCSLDTVKVGFQKGILTKDEYEATLWAQKIRDEMRSEAREKAESMRETI